MRFEAADMYLIPPEGWAVQLEEYLESTGQIDLDPSVEIEAAVGQQRGSVNATALSAIATGQRQVAKTGVCPFGR